MKNTSVKLNLEFGPVVFVGLVQHSRTIHAIEKKDIIRNIFGSVVQEMFKEKNIDNQRPMMNDDWSQ